ncbi:monocarboxylate transporter 12-B-like, partial [Tubulanus polymorphus]|uniref:monocarboxylate transporter 12-B-like n=1 Tax=Tubulanus polymorphus TaxID=672921 RepID=UPI003DA48992
YSDKLGPAKLLRGPVSSVIANRVGFRWLIIVAGLVSFTGMVVSSFATNIYVLMFSFGILTGIGYGLAYTPFAIIPATYFPDKPALTTGLAISGMGLGSAVMPIIIETFIELFGWRGCILILAGISFNICVCGAMIRPLAKTDIESKSRIFDLKIFRSCPYLVFLAHGVLFAMGLSIVFVHLTALVEYQTHCSKLYASRFLTGFGVASFLGRICQGLFSHFTNAHIFTQFLSAYTIAGVSLVLLTTTNSFWELLLFVR